VDVALLVSVSRSSFVLQSLTRSLPLSHSELGWIRKVLRIEQREVKHLTLCLGKTKSERGNSEHRIDVKQLELETDLGLHPTTTTQVLMMPTPIVLGMQTAKSTEQPFRRLMLYLDGKDSGLGTLLTGLGAMQVVVTVSRATAIVGMLQQPMVILGQLHVRVQVGRKGMLSIEDALGKRLAQTTSTTYLAKQYLLQRPRALMRCLVGIHSGKFVGIQKSNDGAMQRVDLPSLLLGLKLRLTIQLVTLDSFLYLRMTERNLHLKHLKAQLEAAAAPTLEHGMHLKVPKSRCV